MLSIPSEMQTRLEAGATTHALCWRIERKDGHIFGFTEHDGDLTFGGTTFLAETGVTALEIETRIDQEASQGGIAGALSSNGITEADLNAGLWDGAHVTLYLVDWKDVSLRVKLWTGELGQIRHDGVGFSADLNGLSRRLERSIGRLFTRHCDASFGDPRCGVDAANPAYLASGMVSALAPTGVVVTGLETFDAGWFSNGQLTWASGAKQRVRAHRVSGQVLLELETPPDIHPQVGDSFSILAGCDKQHASCRDKFANILNFRGFSQLPGNDVLLASPASDSRRDGTSRGLTP